MTNRPGETRPGAIDWAEVHRRMEMIRSSIERGSTLTDVEKKQVLKRRARTLAQEPEKETAREYIELVAFLLADEKYAVESRYVREVYSLKELTRVPCTPAFVLGITSVRGRIIPVLDVRQFFELPRVGLSELDKIVIVESGGMEVGIRTDAVLGVQSVALDEIQPGLPTLTGIRQKYLKGISRERVVILDADKLLGDPGLIVNEEVED